MGEKGSSVRGPWATPAPVRAAFFDVDGTLLSLSQNRVPESALAALSRLRESGVTPVLATGRTHYLLSMVDLSVFDAMVTFNGQLVEVGERVVHSNPLDPADVASVVRQVRGGAFECLFMERDRMYLSGANGLTRAMEELTHNHFELAPAEQALQSDVYQLNVFLAPGEEHLLLDQTSHLKTTRWSDLFVDGMPDVGGKDAGVRIVMDELGLAPEECVAFGDGGNDVDMFGAVGTSVAMGNGGADARAAATYVTDHVDEDGIWNACVRLGLIDAPLWGDARDARR